MASQPDTSPVVLIPASPEDALSHISRRGQSGFRQRLVEDFSFRHPVLHGLWLEVHSCYQRIQLLCKRGRICRLDMGRMLVELSDHRLVENTTSQGRIQNMQKVLSIRSWASPEDMRMFLLGWDLGREWGVRNGDRPGEESIELANPLERLNN